MFSWAATQTVGQSLMHYTGHSRVKVGGVSQQVMLSQISDTNRRTSGHWSHRFSPRGATWGAVSCWIIEVPSSVFNMHETLERFSLMHWCNTVLPRFKKQKGAFINLRLQQQGDRLFFDGGDAFSTLCHEVEECSRNLKGSSTEANDQNRFNSLTICGVLLCIKHVTLLCITWPSMSEMHWREREKIFKTEIKASSSCAALFMCARHVFCTFTNYPCCFYSLEYWWQCDMSLHVLSQCVSSCHF